MESIEILKRILDEMKQHALEAHPNEACGILSGTDFRSCRIHRMTNVESSPVSYFMDPGEQFKLFKEIRETGEKMLCIYHSHPVSEAYPSGKDVELAFYPDVLYIIISLLRSPPAIRCFAIVEKIITEKKIITL